nr:DNA repair protein RadC [Roseomonas acroporae]
MNSDSYSAQKRNIFQGNDSLRALLELAGVKAGSEHSEGSRNLDEVRRLNVTESDSVNLATKSNQTSLLEDFLLYVLDQRRAKYAATRLLDRFGSIAGVMTAASGRLAEAMPELECCEQFLKAAHRVHMATLVSPLNSGPAIKTWSALEKYLRLTLSHEQAEVCKILFLNSKNSLIKDEEHARGSIKGVQIYPREIVRRIIETNASAIIIVHNHPSGDPTPSDEDIELTKHLFRILKDMDVALHDHVIVGHDRCVSMRKLRLF